jgi:hypothetical protein
MREWRYSSTYSLPWYSLEVSGQLHAQAALPLGKEPQYPLDRKLGGHFLPLHGTRVPTDLDHPNSRQKGLKQNGFLTNQIHVKRVFFEKLIVTEIVNKCLFFCGT